MSVDPEIFAIIQHKVERIPHFARVTEVRHILKIGSDLFKFVLLLLVYVCGHNVRSSLSSAFEEMGYCPQHDPLWERLTLQDHIEIYASLRGIAKEDIGKLVR